MPDNQQDPPYPDFGFTPIMIDEWVYPMWLYIKGQRLVSSPDVEVIDAPGGLGKALITGASAGKPLAFLSNVDGEIKNVTFLTTAITAVDPP